MEISDLRLMLGWMQQTQLTQLTLTLPGSHLLLRRPPSDACSLSHHRGGASVATPEYQLAVKALNVGIFLPLHPSHSSPPVAAGAEVQEGDIVAFLRVDALILPVLATSSGILSEPKVKTGERVGYGMTLFTIRGTGRLAV